MIVNKPKYKKCSQYKTKKIKRIEEEEKSDIRYIAFIINFNRELRPFSDNFFRRIQNTLPITEERRNLPEVIYKKENSKFNGDENRNKTLNDSIKSRKKNFNLNSFQKRNYLSSEYQPKTKVKVFNQEPKSLNREAQVKTIVNKNHSLISENKSKSKSKDTKEKKYNKNEKDKKERKEDDVKEPKPKFKKINVESNANNRGNTRQVKNAFLDIIYLIMMVHAQKKVSVI